MASASSQHSRFSDQGVLDLAREVPTTVYKMANGVVLDREHTLIRSDLDELAAGYLRLFEQLEATTRIVYAAQNVADDTRTRQPIDLNYIAVLKDDWESLRAAVIKHYEVSNPASEPKEDQ